MLSSSTVRRSFHQGGNAPSAPCSAVAISHMGLFTFKLNGIKLEKSFPQSHWPHVRYPAGKTPCPEQVNLALGAAQEPVFTSPRGLWGPRSGRSPGAEHVWRTSTSGAASEPVVRGSGGTAGTWPADLPFSPAVSLCPSLSGTVLPVPPRLVCISAATSLCLSLSANPLPAPGETVGLAGPLLWEGRACALAAESQ